MFEGEQLIIKLFHLPKKDDENLVYSSDYSNGKKKKEEKEELI